MDYSMGKVLVTGCAGFIGSHVVEELLMHGWEVVGMDSLTYAGSLKNMESFKTNPKFKFLHGDINDIGSDVWAEDLQGISWIVNLAAHTHVDKSIDNCSDFIHSNISGVKAILDYCRSKGKGAPIRLLHFSTDEVYGVSTDGVRFTEEAPLNPRNPYSATKAAADMLIQSYANTYGLSAVIVRPSNNYGPRQHSEKFIPTVIRCLKEGKKIPVYGDGKQRREWTCVYDTATAVRLLIEKWAFSSAGHDSKVEIFNITSAWEFSNLGLIAEIVEAANEMGIKHYDHASVCEFVPDRPGHDRFYRISPKKLLDATGFQPNFGLRSVFYGMLA